MENLNKLCQDYFLQYHKNTVLVFYIKVKKEKI